MLIAPLSWNLLSGATVSTSALAFQRGWPAANLWDEDPLKPAIWREMYTITANVNDDIDFDDGGGALLGTIAAGTYYSANELGIAAATAMNAVGSNWQVYLLQGSTNRHRWVFKRTSGTGALLTQTGANLATSALRFVFGFRINDDRAAAASHTGDFAAIHTRDILAVDLGAPAGASIAATVGFVAAPRISPSGIITVAHGSTTSVSDGEEMFTYDSEVMALRYSSTISSRYLQFRIENPRRTDAQRCGAGYWYHGPAWDSDAGFDGVDFEPPTLRITRPQRSNIARGKAGQSHVAEIAPPHAFSLGFSGSPGIGPGGQPGIEDLLDGLGTSSTCFVSLDSGELNRASFMCRLTSTPQVTRRNSGHPRGRWDVALDFETVGIH